MTRVTTVKKARKDQGNCTRCGEAIKAGDGYRWWSFRYGGTYRRCMKPECSPRASDLTQNEVLQAAYDLSEEEVVLAESLEDFQQQAEEFSDRINDEVLELIQEKMDNIEQGFGHTDLEAYYNLEEQYGEVESWAESVAQVADQLDSAESDVCEECGLAETDCRTSGEDHEFTPGTDFDAEAAQEALQEALGACPL